MKKLQLPAYLLLLTIWGSILSVPVLAQRYDAEELEIRARPLIEPCRPVAGAEKRIAEALAGLKSTAPLRRREAIDGLARLCHPAGLEAVTGVLADDDPEIRRAAIVAIGQLRDLRVAPPPQPLESASDPLVDSLIRLARDPDWRVRFVLTRTLASLQVYQASNTVLNLMANPGMQRILDRDDLRVRCQAILMVNQLRDVRFSRKSIGFLTTFADYTEPQLKSIVIETVAELEKTRNGYHELVGIARKQGTPQLRIRAMEWLAQWKKGEVRPMLEEIAAADANQRVREAAQLILQSLVK